MFLGQIHWQKKVKTFRDILKKIQLIFIVIKAYVFEDGL
jgi:hypothetical protein